jgi:hypothetical protein
MRLKGTMEIHEDDILVRVERGLVRSSLPSTCGSRCDAREVQILFGLGKATVTGWVTDAKTHPQPVRSLLVAGEEATVPPMSFVVSGIKGRPLADQWLIAGLLVTQQIPNVKPGILASYACATENLLGPTPASEVRAKGMKRDYARTC